MRLATVVVTLLMLGCTSKAASEAPTTRPAERMVTTASTRPPGTDFVLTLMGLCTDFPPTMRAGAQVELIEDGTNDAFASMVLPAGETYGAGRCMWRLPLHLRRYPSGGSVTEHQVEVGGQCVASMEWWMVSNPPLLDQSIEVDESTRESCRMGQPG